MSSETPAILSINFHSSVGGADLYAIVLNHPELPAPLGPPLQAVAPEDRQAIANRVEQISKDMAMAELSAAPQLDQLVKQLQGLGKLLCNTFIPADIKVVLQDLNYPLVISTELNDLPWELLHPGGDDYLALQVPLVRNPVIRAFKPGAMAELRKPRQPPITAMLASNPGQPPLPMAANEVTTLAQLLGQGQVLIKQMGQDLQDSIALRAALANGEITILHYAGHGFFDEGDPSHSFFKVLASNGAEQPITAQQLYDNMAGAPVLFLNACQSAREATELKDFLYLAGPTKGFASLVISGGAVAYVGTQWPVLDSSASLFALAFYTRLLRGASVGQAMLLARRASARSELSSDLRALFPMTIIPETLTSEVTWANFVLYGRPDKSIVTTVAPARNP